MENRKIGETGIKVSPLCFGGNVFGWTIDETASFTLLDAFAGAGYNFIDTADSYSNWAPGNKGGESETIIGKWMRQKGNREQVIIATKLGSDLGGDRKGLSRRYMMQAVEGSLKRLQTDYIDIYQAHFDDFETPQEETLAAFDELVNQGKIRMAGTSNFTAERLNNSILISEEKKLAGYQTLQPLYNLYDRADFEKELQQVCLQKRINVIPYFSLASGFLTGKYRSEKDFSKSTRGGGMKKYMNERGLHILHSLDSLAGIHDSSPAAIALSWLMNQPAILAPIVSATSINQLNEIIAAPHVKLSREEMKMLDEASA